MTKATVALNKSHNEGCCLRTYFCIFFHTHFYSFEYQKFWRDEKVSTLLSGTNMKKTEYFKGNLNKIIIFKNIHTIFLHLNIHKQALTKAIKSLFFLLIKH